MDAQNKNVANLKDSVLTARTNEKKQLTAARKACLQSQCRRLDDVLRLWNNLSVVTPINFIGLYETLQRALVVIVSPLV